MDQPTNLPSKKEAVLYFLEHTSVVQVHLDPRKKGVSLPVALTKQPQIALDLGMNRPVPIRDLSVDDDGITCTLSFNRTPFFCILPWHSIFAMVSHEGKPVVWPNDVPVESPLHAQLTGQVRPKPTLRAVPNLEAEIPQAIPLPKKKNTRKKKGEVEPSLREHARVVPLQPVQAPPPAVAPRASAASDGLIDENPPPPPPKKVKREIPPYLRIVK